MLRRGLEQAYTFNREYEAKKEKKNHFLAIKMGGAGSEGTNPKIHSDQGGGKYQKERSKHRRIMK